MSCDLRDFTVARSGALPYGRFLLFSASQRLRGEPLVFSITAMTRSWHPPRPSYPTAFQVIPERRRLQRSALFLISVIRVNQW
jgi:hypothetical protein